MEVIEKSKGLIKNLRDCTIKVKIAYMLLCIVHTKKENYNLSYKYMYKGINGILINMIID